MKKISLSTFLFALFLLSSLNAQEVVLKTPNMSVDPGKNVQAAIQVENFNEVTGLQFSLHWDSNVLQFTGVDNFGLPEMSYVGNFGTTEAANGTLRFSWYQSALTGVSLADMSSIFSVWFKVIGSSNSVSQLSITDDPTVIEVVGIDSMLPYSISNGAITVLGPSSTQETETVDFILFQNSPNPFVETTYISFNLQQSMQAELTIFDASGKVIFKENKRFDAGLNRIPVNRDIFSGAGAYFYALKTERASAIRQLVAQ